MTEKNFVTKIHIYSYNELSDEDKNLVDMAKEATKASYAPYSKFQVGSALLLNNGVKIIGANQENAAFAGTCGEHVATLWKCPQPPVACAARPCLSLRPKPVSPSR